VNTADAAAAQAGKTIPLPHVIKAVQDTVEPIQAAHPFDSTFITRQATKLVKNFKQSPIARATVTETREVPAQAYTPRPGSKGLPEFDTPPVRDRAIRPTDLVEPEADAALMRVPPPNTSATVTETREVARDVLPGEMRAVVRGLNTRVQHLFGQRGKRTDLKAGQLDAVRATLNRELDNLVDAGQLEQRMAEDIVRRDVIEPLLNRAASTDPVIARPSISSHGFTGYLMGRATPGFILGTARAAATGGKALRNVQGGVTGLATPAERLALLTALGQRRPADPTSP
jgi:hypothetical protein